LAFAQNLIQQQKKQWKIEKQRQKIVFDFLSASEGGEIKEEKSQKTETRITRHSREKNETTQCYNMKFSSRTHNVKSKRKLKTRFVQSFFG